DALAQAEIDIHHLYATASSEQSASDLALAIDVESRGSPFLRDIRISNSASARSTCTALPTK
ncbi:MAG TPA: hypothetical protein VF456_12780, partial [Vicinamibacterales bacterium]